MEKKKTIAELISRLRSRADWEREAINGTGYKTELFAIEDEAADCLSELETALTQVTDTLERTISGFQPEYELCKAYIENANNLLKPPAPKEGVKF